MDHVKKLLLPIVAALACVSCAPPPFNLELSMSALTARSLTMEGTVGPIDKMGGPTQVTDAVFLPEKGTTSGLDLQNGFVLYTTPQGDRQLAFVSWDAAKGTDVKMDSEVSLGPASPGPYADNLLLMLKGAPHFIGMFSFSSSFPSTNSFFANQANPVTGQFPAALLVPQDLGGLAMTITGMTGDVIAASLSPQSDPVIDYTYWLFKAGAVDQFMEMQSFTNASGVWAPTVLSPRPGPPYTLGPGMPAGLTRVLYYYDPAPSRTPQRSFLSWYDEANARWRCWTWWGVSPWQGKELTGVSHRVDALLTTGELFSTEGDVGRLYDRDGALAATFPLTGLRFVGEYYVDGTPRVLFSQLLFYDGRPWFNVYSIPTAGMSALAR